MSDHPEHDGGGQQPGGPDLAAGVAAGQVPEGSVLAGHVNGDAVLLSRIGGRCYAIGASCSHYGARLANGIVVGATIRCPWHHAAFSLRTGAVERPPALNDLPCWSVEERDGRVRVTGRAAPAPARAAGGAPKHPDSVLIVGAGGAGTVAAETLRREGFAGRLVLVDADPDAPVDRPNLSKDYLAGNAPEEWIPLRPPEWFAERGIDHRGSRRVVALDPRERRVQLDDGQAVTYDALLLATGASPVQLPIPMAGLPVHYLRSLADSRAIVRAAEAAGAGARAVVIGASFIGLEVAASLRARGLDVHVVAPESRPLERVMGAELGDFIRSIHEEHGVVFHLGRRAMQVTTDGVVLDTGERLAASLVVAGIGVRPNVELAERAGLSVGQGLLVNEYLETDTKSIFAAGDIARWPDARAGERIRVEHWVVAERQGQTAARNILGAGEPFTAVPFFWSAHYDVMIRYVGHATRWDTVEVDGSLEHRDCAIRFRANGRTLAMASVGRDRAALDEELTLEREIAPAAGAR